MNKQTGITGATGFLGRQLCQYLDGEILTIGRKKTNNFVVDFEKDTDFPVELPPFSRVIHAAGKAHQVPKNSKEAEQFWRINTEGTKLLLDGLSENPPKQFVMISTVAVYGLESGESITEDAPLLGGTPYARSKIEAEQLVEHWCRENGVACLILRLPLLVGPNPPGNLGAMISAIKKGLYFRLGNGAAQKSVLSPKQLALWLNTLPLSKSGIYNLTDGTHPTIAQIDSYIAQKFKKNIKSVPVVFLKFLGKIGDLIPCFPLNSDKIEKLNNTLTFCDNKARKELNWASQPALVDLNF
jgi:GlcNAc-P-P-Und epimerase